MDAKERLLYIGKQMILLSKLLSRITLSTWMDKLILYNLNVLVASSSQGINANEVKNFEPFDQEVFHNEVIFIITLLCHFFPLHFTINRFDCCMLAFKFGPELMTKIIMNQPATYDSVLLQFMDLKMPCGSKIGAKRDMAIFNVSLIVN